MANRNAADQLIRSRDYKIEADVLKVSEQWRAATDGKGWALCPAGRP
jgi:hypothetical protein